MNELPKLFSGKDEIPYVSLIYWGVSRSRGKVELASCRKLLSVCLGSRMAMFVLKMWVYDLEAGLVQGCWEELGRKGWLCKSKKGLTIQLKS